MTDSRVKDPELSLYPLFDAEGTFERPVAADVLLVPAEIEIVEDRLVWSTRPLTNQRWREMRAAFGHECRSVDEFFVVSPGKNMLMDFVRLEDAPADAIRTYARRWGVLGICKHGLPCSHNPWYMSEDYCDPLGWTPRGAYEPLNAWREFSRSARTTLEAASDLRMGIVGSESPAFRRLWGTKRELPPDLGNNIETCWNIVAGRLNWWLAIGDVRPMLTPRFPAGEPLVTLGTYWLAGSISKSLLFGALGVQMLLAVNGEKGLAWCASCGRMFQPKRRPSASHKAYCEACGVRGMWRQAKAAQRERERVARTAKAKKGHRRTE